MRGDICRTRPFRGCRVFIFSKKPRVMHKLNPLILHNSDVEMAEGFVVQDHLL